MMNQTMDGLHEKIAALAALIQKKDEALKYALNSCSCHHGGHKFNDPECPLVILQEALNLKPDQASDGK